EGAERRDLEIANPKEGWVHEMRRSSLQQNSGALTRDASIRFGHHHTAGHLRAIRFEQAELHLAYAGSFLARQLPQVESLDLLDDMLELVREQFGVIGTW